MLNFLGLNRLRHSLRTRSSLVLAFFLLAILLTFYIAGRVVLVHLVKDVELDVRAIETEVNRVAMLNADRIRRHVEGIPPSDRDRPLKSFLDDRSGLPILFAMRLSADGQFHEGCLREVGPVVPLTSEDVRRYESNFRTWVRLLRRRDSDSSLPKLATAGIASIRGVAVYCAIAPCPKDRFLVLGMRFDPNVFVARARTNFADMDMKVIVGGQTPMSVNSQLPARQPAEGANKDSNVVTPFISEALDFYSGGFWKLADNPFEAVFTIRDLADNPVSVITVSLPKTFSRSSESAIGRLTIFVSVLGILLVLPLFLVNSRMLINPLSRMTKCVQQSLAHRSEKEFSRLEWRGDDEFADLAFSINALLESMASRAMAIEQVQNRQRALINVLPDAMLVFDRSHRLVNVVKQLVGAPPIAGLNEGAPIDVTVFGRDGVDAFGAAVDAAFATETMQTLDLESGNRPHRRYLNVRLSLMDEHFVLVIVRDITDVVLDRNRRRAAENRLQHVQKQESLTLFAGSIAHDVNNVLAAVLNMAEIAFLDFDSPMADDALNTIRDAVRRGSTMTRELMAFAGETHYSFHRSDPSKLVEDSRRLIEGVISDGVKVIYDLPKGLPAIDADPDQLWKVFFNLVKNAGESMHGVGEVRITARRFEMSDDLAELFFSSSPLPQGPGVLITIADNGPGIPKHMQRRIFDPYVSSKSAGRGFGLATVNSIIDAHHGGIRVESEEGKGATFGVFLPVSKIAVVRALPPREDAPRPVIAASQVSRSPEVLLVDDDSGILKTTSILLRSLKYTVYTCKDQNGAAELFRRRAETISCVVMDAHLDGGDSLRLMAAIRATNPRTPIVVSSGSAQETVHDIFASQPYDAFLAKPYTLADLHTLLEKMSSPQA